MMLVKSKRDTASTVLFLDAMNMNPNQLYTPSEINKKLANIQEPEVTWNNSFVFQSTDTKYLSDSQLTKALYPLVKSGLLINIRTKEGLKSFIRTQEQQSKKGRRPSVQGRISFYRTSPKLDRLKYLVANEKINKIFYTSLRNSGLLKNYMQVYFRAHLYLLTNEKFFNFLKMANRHLNLTKEEWGKGKKFFASLDDKQVDKVVEIMVDALPMLENRNLFQPHYLMYSIMEI
jgi:hypothetical protein